MSKIHKYWIVQRFKTITPNGELVKSHSYNFKIHTTKESAVHEAERLTKLEHDVFVVLEPVAAYQPPSSVEEVQLIGPEEFVKPTFKHRISNQLETTLGELANEDQ